MKGSCVHHMIRGERRLANLAVTHTKSPRRCYWRTSSAPFWWVQSKKYLYYKNILLKNETWSVLHLESLWLLKKENRCQDQLALDTLPAGEGNILLACSTAWSGQDADAWDELLTFYGHIYTHLKVQALTTDATVGFYFCYFACQYLAQQLFLILWGEPDLKRLLETQLSEEPTYEHAGSIFHTNTSHVSQIIPIGILNTCSLYLFFECPCRQFLYLNFK